MGIGDLTHRSGSFWRIRYREARTHVLIAAMILWSGLVFVTFAAPGPRNLVGHIKGEDFLQIYTLAHLAFEGEYPTIARRENFYDRQVELVPASKGDLYLPVYPPTTALIFRPLTAFSYGKALAVWTFVTIVGYGYIVYQAWKPFHSALPDTGFLVRAAIAFPPFFLLVLFGQTTLIPLTAFFLSWKALRAGFPVAAGVALGALSVKPQFGLVIGVALIFGGNWKVLLGLSLSMFVQLALVTWSMGPQAIFAYVQTVSEMPQSEHLLEPDRWRMHSLRTLTRPLPQPAGDLIWAIASAALITYAVRIWRLCRPLEVRMGMLLLATVLVNPHLFGYDAVILALPIVWLGAWLEQVQSDRKQVFWQGVYILSAVLLLPTALIVPFQASVVVMLWLFWIMVQELKDQRQTELSLA